MASFENIVKGFIKNTNKSLKSLRGSNLSAETLDKWNKYAGSFVDSMDMSFSGTSEFRKLTNDIAKSNSTFEDMQNDLINRVDLMAKQFYGDTYKINDVAATRMVWQNKFGARNDELLNAFKSSDPDIHAPRKRNYLNNASIFDDMVSQGPGMVTSVKSENQILRKEKHGTEEIAKRKGYYYDSKGRLHRPNNDFASKKEAKIQQQYADNANLFGDMVENGDYKGTPTLEEKFQNDLDKIGEDFRKAAKKVNDIQPSTGVSAFGLKKPVKTHNVSDPIEEKIKSDNDPNPKFDLTPLGAGQSTADDEVAHVSMDGSHSDTGVNVSQDRIIPIGEQTGDAAGTGGISTTTPKSEATKTAEATTSATDGDGVSAGSTESTSDASTGEDAPHKKTMRDLKKSQRIAAYRQLSAVSGQERRDLYNQLMEHPEDIKRNFGDYVRGNPHTLAGLGGGATMGYVALQLSDSRGQLTNQQLYGQDDLT